MSCKPPTKEETEKNRVMLSVKIREMINEFEIENYVSIESIVLSKVRVTSYGLPVNIVTVNLTE